MSEGSDQDGAAPPGPGRVRPEAMSVLLKELLLQGASPEQVSQSAVGPGSMVGRFELVRELGRGGFGVVFEARDLQLQRPVAVKLLRLGGTELSEQLQREAELVARLTHPNLVTLYDVGLSPQGPYLVLELLKGQTLQQRLDAGPLPVGEAVRVAVEVARGLAYAHTEGVVHRDLKPSNVFLTVRGAVKLLDFGMAHAFGQRRVSGGTPAYMAPEQWEENPEDERTDVFALGVMLHRMLTGEYPYGEQGGQWSSGADEPAALEVPGAPELGELVRGCLQRVPRSRPRDGAAVLAKLEGIAAVLPAARETGSAARSQRRPPPRPAPAARSRRLLGVLAAAAVLAGTAWYLHARPGAGAPRPSIAVLPFADMSAGHDQEYFADGIAEEILNALAHVDGLKVIGRTSSFSFKGKNEDLRTICQKLGVDNVLEGSVRRQGGRIRVTAQLIRGTDGSHLWSENYDRDAGDVFAVQGDVARSVAAALRVALAVGGAPRAAEPTTASIEAYNRYLRGQHQFRTVTQAGVEAAIAEFRVAVALDAGFAPAWAALADAISVRSDLVGSTPGDPALEEGLAAAEKAVALAPDYAPGYLARGLNRATYRWDWEGGRADYRRALELAPTSSRVLRRLAVLIGDLGQPEESIPYFQRALELDPLDAGTWNTLGAAFVGLGRWEEAREALERCLAIVPTQEFAHSALGDLELLRGRPSEALRIYATLGSASGRLIGAALANHSLGRDRESREALAALEAAHGDELPVAVAQVHAWRGETDEAFPWLERAIARHDPGLREIKHDWRLRSLHGDPRFRALLRKMNLPVD